MKIRTVLTVIIAAILLVGCSGPKDTTSDLPSWYTSPPSSDNEYMYAVGEATSSRRSMARKQAIQDGRAQMALKLQSEVSAMQKNFAEEITSGSQSNYREVFTDVSKSVAQQTLRGVEVSESAFFQRDSNQRHEVLLLVRLPVGEAANALNQALSNTLSRDEEMYTEFKASKAFKDMKQSIENMKDGNMPSEDQ